MSALHSETTQDEGVVRNLLGCEPLVYFHLAAPKTHVHAHEHWNHWPNASDLLQQHAVVLRKRHQIPRPSSIRGSPSDHTTQAPG